MQNAVPFGDHDHAAGEMVERRSQRLDFDLLEVHEIADRHGPTDMRREKPQDGDFPIGYGAHRLVTIGREDANAAPFAKHDCLD
jgi:hypothetical protein